MRPERSVKEEGRREGKGSRQGVGRFLRKVEREDAKALVSLYSGDRGRGGGGRGSSGGVSEIVVCAYG